MYVYIIIELKKINNKIFFNLIIYIKLNKKIKINLELYIHRIMFKRSREIDDGEDDSKRYKNSSENEVYSLLAPIDSYISASSSFSR